MKLDVVLGLQWGDEGKGKIVDVLAGRYPAVARFQGGPNAGHSLHFVLPQDRGIEPDCEDSGRYSRR